MGRYNQAVTAYQDGIRAANRDDADYYLMLADAYFANKQTQQACVEWKRVQALRSGRGDEDELAATARRNIAAHCRG